MAVAFWRPAGAAMVRGTWAALAGVALAASPAHALWLDLRPAQVAEAVAYGRAARDVSPEVFEREWRVVAEGGGGVATVDSEFLVLARVARELARRRNPEDLNLPEALCAFLAGPALYVGVTLQVPGEEEARALDAWLEAGARVIAPLDVWPDQFVVRETGPAEPSGIRVSHYLKFPLDGIDRQGRVIVVTRGSGARIWRFVLDLGAMR